MRVEGHRAGPHTKSPVIRVGITALTLVLAIGVFLGTIAAAPPATAQQVQRIAAVVNDEIISLYDVQARLDLVISSSQLPDTPETRSRLLPSVLQQLVDERLKLQEAERLKVTVSEAEIESGKRQIERNNNMPQGSLDRFLAQANIDPQTLETQIRADIAWIKIARGHLQRSVSVEPEEVDAVLDALRRNQGKPQHLLAEIVLPVNGPDQENRILDLAQRLREQIRDGASFPSLARQFSASPTAAVGGDLGWVVQGQLPSEVGAAVQTMKPGEVSRPIRTASGYHLVLLRERRNPANVSPEDVPVTLSQLFMPTQGPAALSAERRQDIQRRARAAESCEDVDRMAADLELPSSGPVGRLTPSDLPPPVREAVMTLEENRLSDPISLDNGDVMVMVCRRHHPGSLPSREEIERRLEEEKLERVALRKLRDLRRAALIDVRL